MKAISGKELCRILELNGWTLLKIRGSHRKYEKAGNLITVPVHSNKPLKKGTLSKILKDAGLWGKV
jgi:predicted RNA binding protein YcfA (HicA-like mRNA interferase family)